VTASTHSDNPWHEIADLATEAVVESSLFGVALLDSGGHLTFANDELCRLLCSELEELKGDGYTAIIGLDTARHLCGIPSEGSWHESRLDDTDTTFMPGPPLGDAVLVRARSWPLRRNGEFVCRVAVFVDVSDRATDRSRRRVADELIGTLMDSVTDAVLVMNSDGRIESASRAVESVFGWPSWSVVGAGIRMLFNPLDRTGDRLYLRRLLGLRGHGGTGSRVMVSGHHRDGTVVPLELRIVENSGTSPSTYVGFIRDLREIERLTVRLDLASRTDELTGLLSQRSFMSELRAMVEHSDVPWSVAKIDLSRFRYVNRAHGFSVGDEILRSVARDIGALVPDAPVGRVGGDRFAFVVPTGEVEGLVWEIRSRIEGRGRAGGISHPLRVNVGVAHFTGRESAEDLMQASDSAARAAKSSSEQFYRTFDTQMQSIVDAEIELVGDLHAAINSHQLETWFQPEVDLRDRSIIGHEALVRWRHPTRGIVSPDLFLPSATSEGLMPSLGVEVFGHTLDFIRKCERLGHRGRVWVNLSAGQLFDDSVLRYAKAAIEFGVSPDCLGFELTEQDAIDVASIATDNFTKLMDLGVGLAIDDFGTGYSTLSQLRHVPAGVVKLDRSFLAEIHTDARQRNFVGACINLAHTLDMRVIVEGIETEADALLMADMGCESAQGYWFGRPAPPAEALRAI